VAEQTLALVRIAQELGTRVRYCKPHGALGNLAAKDTAVAQACARAIHGIDPKMGMLAMAGSALEDASIDIGLPTYGEIYTDRAYDDRGKLVARTIPGAVIEDEAAAVERLLRYLRTGRMATASGGSILLGCASVCVHGDNAHAVSFARDVRALLEHEGFDVRAFAG
jgi:UPF0271 protein